METVGKPHTGTLVLQTIVAMVLALITYVIVATLAGAFFYFMNAALTVIRPGIIQFFAAIVGSIAGMIVAKIACEAVLKNDVSP